MIDLHTHTTASDGRSTPVALVEEAARAGVTVLGVTDWLVQPFVGMFRFNDVRSSTGAVLDVAAIVALVAWTILEWIILAIINVFRPGTPVDA